MKLGKIVTAQPSIDITNATNIASNKIASELKQLVPITQSTFGTAPIPVSTSAVGPEILIEDLMIQRQRLDQNSHELNIAFRNLNLLLNSMASVMGINTTLGKGVGNLSEAVISLSTKCNQNLTMISEFCKERIQEAQAGNQTSIESINALAAHLQSLEF